MGNLGYRSSHSNVGRQVKYRIAVMVLSDLHKVSRTSISKEVHPVLWIESICCKVLNKIMVYVIPSICCQVIFIGPIGSVQALIHVPPVPGLVSQCSPFYVSFIRAYTSPPWNGINTLSEVNFKTIKAILARHDLPNG